jgi:hypothetical protein
MPISFDTLTSILTVVGVGVACYQLWQTQKSLRDGFERSFFDRYQKIADGLPPEILLGQPNGDRTTSDWTFYKYFELCEEELYYRAHRRVSADTWRDWWYGICQNMRTEAFKEAFDRLIADQSSRSSSRFVYLNQARDQFENPRFQPRRIPAGGPEFRTARR